MWAKEILKLINNLRSTGKKNATTYKDIRIRVRANSSILQFHGPRAAYGEKRPAGLLMGRKGLDRAHAVLWSLSHDAALISLCPGLGKFGPPILYRLGTQIFCLTFQMFKKSKEYISYHIKIHTMQISVVPPKLLL